MTKTLTEQWREGTLTEGYYYTKLNDNAGTIAINYCWDDGCFQDYCDNMIDEVLAPVPSYDEYLYLKTNNDHWNKEAIRISKQAIGIVLESDELEQKMHILEKKLEIATKALKKLTRNCNKWEIAREALKETEGVK